MDHECARYKLSRRSLRLFAEQVISSRNDGYIMREMHELISLDRAYKLDIPLTLFNGAFYTPMCLFILKHK